MTTASPPPGLIGLTSINGDVGKLIRLGQFLNGDGFTLWEHAFITIGDGLVVQAEPGGARVEHVSHYKVVHWCYGIYKLATAPATYNVPMLLETAAKKYVGVPYSAEDYFALAAHRLHLPFPGLKKYVADSGHMICSQLVDQCYRDAGKQIFTDNRWPGYVTPGALFQRDAELLRS